MSRIANTPVDLPSTVKVSLDGQNFSAKGEQGSVSLIVHRNVIIKQKDNVLTFVPKNSLKSSIAIAGTIRALVNNMVIGVSTGFKKKLILNGVGYRTKVIGDVINLVLGFSHDVNYKLPKGVKAETPSQTEIILKSADKQLLGQVASEIRSFRPPEPYKGKGIFCAGESIHRKEAKKK